MTAAKSTSQQTLTTAASARARVRPRTFSQGRAATAPAARRAPGRACSWDGGVAARSCTASVCNSTCEATRANCVKPNASLPDDGCESAATCGLPCTCSYVVVSAVADTQLRQDHPTFNYGASYAIWADQGASDSKTSLVRFDLGTIPTGASIVSAFLHIFVSDNDSGDVYTLHRVLEAWDEGDGGFAGAVVAGATWNQRQGGVPWTDRDGGCGPEGSCTADAGGSFKPNSTWTWFMPSVDSTWVHNWHNGTYVNYGLAIRSVIAGDDGVHFASKDAPDAGDFAGAGAYIDAGPRLEVWFVVP
ncbi:MAG: DNRLRE domain-containing protein [Deltaproteobacteria bacterium]|nr:DNRLRE domain-containing protein [Deltaproteobacteria bacterium]